MADASQGSRHNNYRVRFVDCCVSVLYECPGRGLQVMSETSVDRTFGQAPPVLIALEATYLGGQLGAEQIGVSNEMQRAQLQVL